MSQCFTIRQRGGLLSIYFAPASPPQNTQGRDWLLYGRQVHTIRWVGTFVPRVHLCRAHILLRSIHLKSGKRMKTKYILDIECHFYNHIKNMLSSTEVNDGVKRLILFNHRKFYMKFLWFVCGHLTHHIRIKGLDIDIAYWTAGEGPNLGLVLEGCSHLEWDGR